MIKFSINTLLKKSHFKNCPVNTNFCFLLFCLISCNCFYMSYIIQLFCISHLHMFMLFISFSYFFVGRYLYEQTIIRNDNRMDEREGRGGGLGCRRGSTKFKPNGKIMKMIFTKKAKIIISNKIHCAIKSLIIL